MYIVTYLMANSAYPDQFRSQLIWIYTVCKGRKRVKSGNRIGSNPVLSELIRSLELQHPVRRSLTPKWDLTWVLICLQKAPYEPLHKVSKHNITIKIAFLLALPRAKRCSEIHALAMDSNHLRFN